MTKENKAGLVAAGAFVVLVAAVVTLKMHDAAKPAAPDPGDQVAQATPPLSVPAQGKADDKPDAIPAKKKGAAEPGKLHIEGNAQPESAVGDGTLVPVNAPEKDSGQKPGPKPDKGADQQSDSWGNGAPTRHENHNNPSSSLVVPPSPEVANPVPGSPPTSLGEPNPVVLPGKGEKLPPPSIDANEDLPPPSGNRALPQQGKTPDPKNAPLPSMPPAEGGITPVRADAPIQTPLPPAPAKEDKNAPPITTGDKKTETPGGPPGSPPPSPSDLLPPTFPEMPASPTSPAMTPVQPPVEGKAPHKDELPPAPPPAPTPSPAPLEHSTPPVDVRMPAPPPDGPPPPKPSDVTQPSLAQPKKGPDKDTPVVPAQPRIEDVAPPLPTVIQPPAPTTPAVRPVVAPREKKVSAELPPKQTPEPSSQVGKTTPGKALERSTFIPDADQGSVGRTPASDRGTTVGTPRPVVGSAPGDDVIRAGHTEPKPAPEPAPWHKAEAISPAPASSEKPLPRTAPISVGDTPYRPVSLTQPARSQRYDVTIYQVQANDTWERVSQVHYGHERCADALRAFNQQHARSAIQRNGALNAGDTVVIPPLSVLLDNHGPLIRSLETKQEAKTPAPPPNTLPAIGAASNKTVPMVNPTAPSNTPATSGFKTAPVPAPPPPDGLGIAPPPPPSPPGPQ